MNDDTLVFRDEANSTDHNEERLDPWTILIVDDDRDVHDATVFTLRDSVLLERPLKFLHAYSANETILILKEHPEIALILLDAVMETEDAGLSAVKVIREDLGMEDVRIILRTGQPGQIPELDTIAKYDINDYKTKSELNRTKLLTAIIGALRSWQQIQRIQNSRRGLEKIIDASNQFIVEQGLRNFAEGVITQMAGLLGLEPEGIVCASRTHETGESLETECQVIAAAGHYRELINRNVNEIGNQEILSSIEQTLLEKRNIIGKNSISLYFAGPPGRSYATWVESPRPLKELDTNLLGIFCTNISLCASNIDLVDRLKLQAWEDPGLGIPNMLALLERLQKQIDEERPRNDLMAVIDIDGFDQINELLGHDYGDVILQLVVDRLRELLGSETFFARVGADAFAILGDEADFGPKTLKALSAIRLQSPDGDRELSVSIGITRIDPTVGNASTQLRNAMLAVKRAKGEGIGQVVRYSPEIGEETRDRIRLLHELKGAFATSKLFLMFQPQVRLKDRQVFCYEALLRWKTDEGSFVPPDRFIPLAEQTGLIVPIGTWVLRTALRSLKQIHRAGFPDMRMAVNVSPMQLRRNDFLEHLDGAIEETGMDPTLLELEITESISVIGTEDTKRLLGAIRERGISIAVDDFGTGYSSLSSIDRWPVNRLKIDKTFVHNMEQREEGARLVDLVIPLGNRLSMKVLAEGVETEAQMARLSDLGCDEVQGYLISKPLVLDDLIAWMQQNYP